MPEINFAALREHHITAAHYERIREVWFRRSGNTDRASRCAALARHHDRSAQDALMGISDKKK